MRVPGRCLRSVPRPVSPARRRGASSGRVTVTCTAPGPAETQQTKKRQLESRLLPTRCRSAWPQHRAWRRRATGPPSRPGSRSGGPRASAPHLRPGPVYNERADRGRPPVGLGLPAPPRALALRRVPAVRPGRPARSRTRPSAAAVRRPATAADGDGAYDALAAACGGAARPTRAPGASRGRAASTSPARAPRLRPHYDGAPARRPPRRSERTRRGPFRAVPGPGGSGPGGCAPHHQADPAPPGRVDIPGAGDHRRGAVPQRDAAHALSPTAATEAAPVDGAGACSVESEAAAGAGRATVDAPRPGLRSADPDAAAAPDTVAARRRLLRRVLRRARRQRGPSARCAHCSCAPAGQ